MERRAIEVTGVVQGVGFRPFVYGLATRLGLCGFVRNHNARVEIEIEGDAGNLDRFVEELRLRPPPLARIESINSRRLAALGTEGFEIRQSQGGAPTDTRICPDIATCDDCIAELLDPGNRRFGYPFINCTNCGPRLTIVLDAPYDRQRTTMAGFAMCADCRREYDDPADRRFHAQPIACAVCGPALALLDGAGCAIAGGDPLIATIEALRSGQIVAIKGLGGFHLCCDAANSAAVGALRRRKHREEKPFAVMTLDIASAGAFCDVQASERDLLHSRARPIVLLRKHAATDLADEVAPDNPSLGVMLPYTPLHHLLLRGFAGKALVMTSGNRSDEPIAYENADAIKRMAGIADLFLTHDRPIHVRCDDSVARWIDRDVAVIRRSRGFAPQPVTLPLSREQTVLAVGGQLKSTFALGRGRQAMISHHLGDLDHFDTLRAFERDVRLYEELFAMQPRVIVHDLHPDYASTRYALARQQRDGIPSTAVQHHHAHMASCMAEHGLCCRVIGVCFDGTGYGTDGAIWGGEFLVGDYRSFDRVAHLRYVAMPGAEQAIHQPWRMALSHLRDAGVDPARLASRVEPMALRTAQRMLERGFNAPLTSSAGRLFDAAASLAGVRDVVQFEAQAAMQLEWLAAESGADGAYPWATGPGSDIDTRPIIQGIEADVAAGCAVATIARRFHTTMAELIRGTCIRLREEQKINVVVLSGGVFLNALLAREALNALAAEGFAAYRHKQIPTNDGGLSLGQLIIGFSRL